MVITYEYMLKEILSFRERMCSTAYNVEQKDDAFKGLMYGWIHSKRDMTDEEEESLTTLMQAHISEWSRRRAYETIQNSWQEDE
jgi:hypothetical protein